MFRKFILPALILWFYKLLTFTWRIELVEDEPLINAIENKKPIIFAHWHGHELAIIFLVSRYKLATMTSFSKDGQLVDFVIRKLGGVTSKGSSSKGAVSALKGLIRLIKKGHPASMAVDGPRGPIYQVKPGVFELSRLSQAQIFPVGVYANNPFVFKKSWNKAQLPMPFSRVCIFYGEPMPPLDKSKSPKDLILANELKKRISDACQHASKLIATKKSGC